MTIQPINDTNFGNRIYKFTKITDYGKRIYGESNGYRYDVYVKEDSITKNIEHKLYCIFKGNKWVKSFLRYFEKNKLTKEIRSQAR